MAALLPVPGALVCWLDEVAGDSDKPRWRMGFIVHLDTFFNTTCYTMTVIEEERLKTWTLFKQDNGNLWRVTHAK